MEESNKASDFNKEFSDIIDDLTIDDQVSKIEKTVDHNLSEIKKLIKLLPLIKENSDFNEYSKKLTKLMKTLVQQINENNCNKTKETILKLFGDVDSTIFKTQLNFLNKELKK